MAAPADAQEHFGTTGQSRTGRWHLLMPVLIGLLAPILALLLVDARALASFSVMIQIYLIAMLIIAAGAFVISIFDQGEVTKVVLDKQKKVAVVERTGLLATRTVEIPFVDIASIRIETRYDDDGYKAALPVLTLSSRETIPLPAGTGEAEVATMRAIVGRH
jgi:hypothetical protein